MQTAYWLDEGLNYHAPAALRASAESLLEALYEASGLKRKAKDKHLPQLEIVLLGLLKASQTQHQCMAIQLGANTFSKLENLKYRVTVKLIIRVTVKLIIDGLLKLQLLTIHKGYYEEMMGVVSRLQLTEPMLRILEDADLDPNLIVINRTRQSIRSKPPECISN